jgi:hypothetical protein
MQTPGNLGKKALSELRFCGIAAGRGKRLEVRGGRGNAKCQGSNHKYLITNTE